MTNRRQLDLFDEWRERVRVAAWRAVRDADCLPDLAHSIRELNRWTCSARTAESIVSKWLSPDERRPLPAYLLPIITAFTGEDMGVVQTQLEAAHEHRNPEPDGMRAPMAKVQPHRTSDRRRA